MNLHNLLTLLQSLTDYTSFTNLVIALSELQHVVNNRFIRRTMSRVIFQGQSINPALFVQVQQHLLLKLVLAVVDRNRVVVAVQAVDQGLDAGLVQVADI